MFPKKDEELTFSSFDKGIISVRDSHMGLMLTSGLSGL